ncbi:MAG: type I-B CRISPR-associated protein Cas5b [Saprospiraceae bacterium]
MEVYRINITSWTASFRYPNIISGIQPTLEVPPLSTVLGLTNAAAGQYLKHQNLKIGYFFKYEAKAEDLETIYQYKVIEKTVKGVRTKQKDKYGNYQVHNSVKSNIVLRHFLFNNQLSIYLTDNELVKFFRNPYYQLVLGRSNDLATIESIAKVDLIPKLIATNIRGQIIPLNGNYLPGQIQALPKYFSDSIPRKNLGTEPYSIINHKSPVGSNQLEVFYDKENDVDIYFHKYNANKI